MSPGPNVASVIVRPSPCAADRPGVALAHDVAGVARIALAEDGLAGPECAGTDTSAIRSKSTRSSVEKTAPVQAGRQHRRTPLSIGRNTTTGEHGRVPPLSSPECPTALSLPLLAATLLAHLWSPRRTGGGGAEDAVTRAAKRALLKALLRSRELWATVDVCNPADQPDTVGVRGSMPGDKQRPRPDVHELPPAVPGRGEQAVGRPSRQRRAAVPSRRRRRLGAPGRHGASSSAAPGRPAFMLRGVVVFQWRRGAR